MSAATEEQTATKGTNGINGVADDEVHLMTEEELEKAKMRPADIDQDMKEMERRKRVENIMNSALFREELERIIETQIQEGYTGYQTLQNISEMIGIPTSRINSFKGAQCVIPINDIRGMESLNYAKGEKILRCKLASLYRLIDMHGWTQNIYNHCTARVSQDTEHFLLNPFGLLYHEVTASSLVKVDMQGNIVDPGSTNFGVNVAGFLLHSAIHAQRPDLRCIIHIHHPAVVAVSALKQGLLPVSQESLLIGDVSYHDYYGLFVNAEEKELLSRNLGPINKIMILRNHGVVCGGESIEEAWYNAYHTVLACEAQMRMAPLGLDNLVLVSDEAKQAAYETARRSGAGGVDSKQEGGASQQGQKERKYKVGEIEFEALMRTLDNAGLRTGFIYRRPLVKAEPARLQSDVALPPAASNFSHLFDEDDLNRSPLKRILDGRKAQDKTRWLNSPNTYSKVEVLETGTPDPKKITKWVADESPTHSTSVKFEDPLMFVPKDTDPKEFKKIQKMIKENRRIGNISAGPTSHVLEGMTWEEARRMQDASMSSASDHVILVGAASKGIIQREFQHNAVVYKTPYAKNPFDAISDQELEDYKNTIERKQKGEPEEITVEQINITPEMATRDIVDDANVPKTDPMSPLSDEDEGKVVRQKPAVPPKPNIPKPVGPQGTPGTPGTPVVVIGTPQRVHANQPPDGEFASRVTPARATLPRTPHSGGGKSSHNSQPRTNSLSRGLAKMLKLSRSNVLANGEDAEAHHSTLSQSSKEGSPTKDTSLTDDSISKEKKKKKKGLRTPSFLKKKKDKKKEKEATAAHS
ncbi:Protein hu-li tai shao [Armadillidium nasatum]|uniref:Protein hu-li tai shao n=1 Tax=Armadillidium nasatum TaxID=96803 RepID=A0A5N5SP52_9CRUS|nr:Protein hu-li tai shao [Armadillidium nasatum]